MSQRRLAEEAACLSASSDLHIRSLAAQLERLNACNAALLRHASAQMVDRGVQAALGKTNAGALTGVSRRGTLQPFSFGTPTKHINWRRVRSISVEQLVEEGDTATAMALFEDVAYGDLTSESSYNLTEASLRKLLGLAQLQLQYLQHQLWEAREEQEALEQAALSLHTHLAAMPALDLGCEQQALAGLEKGMRRLGSTRIDAMLKQARGQL